MPDKDTLFIGEPNLIYCEVNNRDGTPVTGATVTFTITENDIEDNADVADNAIGTAGASMSYNAAFVLDPDRPTETIEAYVGTLSAVNAALLDPYDATLNPGYRVGIPASGDSLRMLEKKAGYRGRV